MHYSPTNTPVFRLSMSAAGLWIAGGFCFQAIGPASSIGVSAPYSDVVARCDNGHLLGDADTSYKDRQSVIPLSSIYGAQHATQMTTAADGNQRDIPAPLPPLVSAIADEEASRCRAEIVQLEMENKRIRENKAIRQTIEATILPPLVLMFLAAFYKQLFAAIRIGFRSYVAWIKGQPTSV